MEEAIKFLQENKRHISFESQTFANRVIGMLKAGKPVAVCPDENGNVSIYNEGVFIGGLKINKDLINETIYGGQVKPYLEENIYPNLNQETHPDLKTDLQWFLSEGCGCDEDLVLIFDSEYGLIQNLTLTTSKGNVRIVYTRDPSEPGRV